MQLDLKKAMKIIYVILLGLVTIGATYVIGLLIYGAIANVGISGDVTVPAEVQTAINTSVTDFAGSGGLFEKITDNLALVLSLLAIVVILAVFGFMLFKKGKGGNDF